MPNFPGDLPRPRAWGGGRYIRSRTVIFPRGGPRRSQSTARTSHYTHGHCGGVVTLHIASMPPGLMFSVLVLQHLKGVVLVAF